MNRFHNLPLEIIQLIVKFLPVKRLHEWIPEEELNWMILSENPAAIKLLTNNQDKIDWL